MSKKLKIDLLKIRKCFAHYLQITFAHKSVNVILFKKILLCPNLKSKIKNPIYSAELQQIHKYDRENNSSLKFILCTISKLQNFYFESFRLV